MSSSKENCGNRACCFAVRCTFCNYQLMSGPDWTRHLLTTAHQSRCWYKFSHSWYHGLKPERERIIVLFTQFDVSSNPHHQGHFRGLRWLANLQQLWKVRFENVWWRPIRPRVLYIHLARKEDVKRIGGGGVGGPMKVTINLGRDSVLVKKATDCNDLEWNGMMETFLNDLVSFNTILDLK